MTTTTLGDQLRAYTGTNPFLLDIRAKMDKGLSARQAEAAMTALKREVVSAQAKSAAAAVNFGSIQSWMAQTGQHLQYPKFHFIVADTEMVLRFKKAGARPGTVDVVTHEKFWSERFQSDMPDWFGRIELNGSLTASARLTMEIEQALERIAADPLKAAVEFGRLTNRCAFCRRDLNTVESVELGYGPVCAKKHGLVHSREAAATKRALRDASIDLQFKAAFAEREREQEAASFMAQSLRNGN